MVIALSIAMMRLIAFNRSVRILLLLFGLCQSSFVEVDIGLRTTSSVGHRVLDWGDYAEYPEYCPATTTCPLICVPFEDDCPTSCPDGLTLCIDGNCETECAEDLESPCACEERNVTCAKVIDFYDACKEKYEYEYNATIVCIAEQEDSIEKISFTGPWFIFVYSWISAITVLVILWCAFNQKISPVPGAVQMLIPVGEGDSPENAKREWTQTGYKKNLIGTIVCYLVWLTIWGIQFLLLMLTIFYYMQQEAVTRWPPVFLDEGQVLTAFELVWFVGFLWTFAFQWPYSIESLFFRRCSLDQATHVAVEAPTKKVKVTASSNSRAAWGLLLVKAVWYPFDLFLRTVFSYPHAKANYETSFCKVIKSGDGYRSFYFRMSRYVFNQNKNASFIPGSVEIGLTIGDLIDLRGGLSTEKAAENSEIAGSNIILMDKPTMLGSIMKEFSKSFYVYQNFMVWTWAPYWYYYMAMIHTFVRLTGGLVVSYFQYMSDSVLYKISIVEGDIYVIRGGLELNISVKDVVPGDIVVLKPGTVFCDMVVVESDHLMVDEAALTGESNPIAKKELDASMRSETYERTLHKVHTIYAGSEIIETGENGTDRGLVISTGSSTMKGQLLTDILSYQRHKFLFDDEIMVVLLILFLQAVFYITLVFQWLEDQFVYAFFYAAFILAALIPPLLPTVFVVSVGISSNRLREKNITCTNPEGILVAGKVNVCCFDKTGTITEQSMDFVRVECNNNEEMGELCSIGMAVCHTLKVTGAGEVVGNHMDKASFKASVGDIKFKKGKDVVIEHRQRSYTIIKHFDFDNHRQTQSVVVRFENGSIHIFVKGSPEAIKGLSKSESIPNTFDETLRTGAKAGLYQLAIAHKEYDGDKDASIVSRNDLERSLIFCGFLEFKNPMKEETPDVMAKLAEGNILMTMITGDNVLTGISIARESKICVNSTLILGQIGEDKSIEWVDVDSDKMVDIPSEPTRDIDLAITGEAFAALLYSEPQFAYNIAKYVRVFGRCNPIHKVNVINTLCDLGYITLMCGDGQNDCGALKSAHVGVALSSSDASIVAPFTSLDLKVTSVVDVLLEGRCALSSAFKAYSYYILYGQVEACLQVILANLFVTFTDWCWFFLDGVWAITMAFSLPLAHAATKLSPCRPTASLLGIRTLFSVCGMLAFNYFFIMMSLVALNQQEWYQCRKWNSNDVSDILVIGDNFETETLFVVGGYQYVSTAIALNFGYTFRAPWYKNYIFVFLAGLFTAFQFIMTLYPSNFSCIWRVNCDNTNAVSLITSGGPMPIQNPWNTTVMPSEYRWILVGIMIANVICLCVWEYFFVNWYLYKTYKFGKDDPLSDVSTMVPHATKEIALDEDSDD